MEQPRRLATSINCKGDLGFEVVAKALERLASIDLIEFCNEAKVERCRAIRDLRGCGRYVQHVLNSCGHASLCEECSQRCNLCPICRNHVPKINDRLRLRLYYECIEAGLISKRCDDRLHEEEDREDQIVDVQRLYSLFDVALENNLVSLICHYVTDVCMDESAVSSDPVIAILLDDVVVKDWCKRTFKIIVSELQGIYNCAVEEIKSRLDLLVEFSIRLGGISKVLEVLESSFKSTLSAHSHDLHHLQECVLKTMQHLEIMMWCVRLQFLEHVRLRYTNFSSWRFAVRERKSAAIRRSWPNSVNHSAESTRQEGSLFIEDALSNLDIEQAHTQETGVELDIASLQKDDGLSVFRSKIEGMEGCYPFENLRAATDILFLHGSSDMVVAKQAIFIYYLFDRHWTVPDENWRHIVDDFAASFGIGRHSLLESFTFYLLDDHTDEALQEACHILPEISGPTTHPKIAEVLLERQNPDAALMVLRWSGRDGAQYVPLGEAVTAIRVRVECALLTEAFMYQKDLCMKIKDRKLKHGPSRDASGDLRNECRTWKDWVDALVTEICCLCIRRNLVDRMIELPWNCDEEIYLHKCLLEYATEDPSTTVGSLLVVFYLQRYRYPEAYQVDRKLQNIEQDYFSKNSASAEALLRMRSASQWRAALVDKSLEFLPEVQQRQVRTGKFPKIGVSSVDEADLPATSDILRSLEPKSTSLLVPSSVDSPLVMGSDLRAPSLKPSVSETPSNLAGSVRNVRFEAASHCSTSVLLERFFTNSERGHTPQTAICKSSKLDDISILGVRRGTPFNSSPPSHFSRSSSRVLQNSLLQDNHYNKVLPTVQQNDLIHQFENTSPLYSQRAMGNPAITPNSGLGSSKSSARESYPNGSNKRSAADGPDKFSNIVSSDDPMDVSWRYRENGSAVEDLNIGGPRWRSDETSDDEEDKSLERAVFQKTPMRGTRKSRFARR